MQPSFFDRFLSTQERVLYKQHVTLIVLNFPIFVVANILLYLLATLLFINAISWQWHISFAVPWVIIATITALYTEKIAHKMCESPAKTVIWLTTFGVSIALWWMVYFTVLSRAYDAMLMQQFVVLMGMLTFIGIATVGRFSRLMMMFLLSESLYFIGFLIFWPVNTLTIWL